MSLRENKNFRSITPNEYIKENTLVWIERFKDSFYNVEVEGPYVIDGGWGPSWFGSKNTNNLRPKDFVTLISTVTGECRRVTHRNFLAETYYVINEEMLCIDVETE